MHSQCKRYYKPLRYSVFRHTSLLLKAIHNDCPTISVALGFYMSIYDQLWKGTFNRISFNAWSQNLEQGNLTFVFFY